MKQARQEKTVLTMAQELERMLNDPDEDDGGVTLRQALCRAIVREAKQGNLRALEWVYEVSGEKRRESGRRSRSFSLEDVFSG